MWWSQGASYWPRAPLVPMGPLLGPYGPVHGTALKVALAQGALGPRALGPLGPPRGLGPPQNLARQPQSLAQQPQSLTQQPQSLAQQQLWRQQQVWQRARGCAARVLLFLLAPDFEAAGPDFEVALVP